jgi:ParB family chromosome partitioning protein
VSLARIRANPFQPRQHFDEEALTALVDSIRVVGVLQPVLVREVGEEEFELIAGERRCRAARRAGLQSVPALVQPATDTASLEQALIENLHREDLNPLEEAAAYKQLIEEFELTHDEVARRVGRSRAAVSNALRLMQLPPAVQRLVREQALSAGHARALLGTPDRELQEQLARRAVEEGLSVRAVEELVRAALRGSSAPWSTVLDTTTGTALTGSSGDHAGDLSGDLGEDAGGRLQPGPSAETGDAERGSETRRSPTGAPSSGARAGSAAGSPLTGTAGEASHSVLRPPGVLELEELLADHLNTRVRVEMGAKHGRVVVEFATLEDLERIYRVMIGDLPPSS